MKSKALIFPILFFILFCTAQDDAEGQATNVAIEKTDDNRTQAIVTSPASELLDEKGEFVGEAVDTTVEAVSKRPVDVLETSSDVVGKGTDKVVGTAQKSSDSAFGWLFRLLDFKKDK